MLAAVRTAGAVRASALGAARKCCPVPPRSDSQKRGRRGCLVGVCARCRDVDGVRSSSCSVLAALRRDKTPRAKTAASGANPHQSRGDVFSAVGLCKASSLREVGMRLRPGDSFRPRRQAGDGVFVLHRTLSVACFLVQSDTDIALAVLMGACVRRLSQY